jgi:pimeloyl-ACP methyl ester carboxylesterase
MYRVALFISLLLEIFPVNAELHSTDSLNENESDLLASTEQLDELSGPEIVTGEIEGALYTIAKPSDWNGRLLIYAHGLRYETEPLDGSLNPNGLLYSTLLQKGWMVAMSSYRRNGIIIDDAILDLNNLLGLINSKYGEPKRVILMGHSMGGAIGTLIAENLFEEYDGVLAIGAALPYPGRKFPIKINHNPKIPLLFLTNRSELPGPQAYIEGSKGAALVPVLWRVDRDGHVNVNDNERVAAIAAIENWIETGEIDRQRDGTIAGRFIESSAEFSIQGAKSAITGVSANYGNIFTGYVESDLKKLNLSIGDNFHLRHGEATIRVLWGTNYNDVGEGEWVAFIFADGNLMIAKARENGCAILVCNVGDDLYLIP